MYKKTQYILIDKKLFKLYHKNMITEVKKSLLNELMTKTLPQKNKEDKKKIKLIVGLGNPDKKYFDTYHNIGFCFIDKLSVKLDIKVKKKECKSITGEGFIERVETVINPSSKEISTKVLKDKIILAKPQTYMNLSGEAVNELMKKYKISEREILIISDDIDLPVGNYRFREAGSAGTHNGLRNIIQIIKTSDFKRIRIGIDKDDKIDLADYVLLKVSKENREKINKTMDDAIDFLQNNLF